MGMEIQELAVHLAQDMGRGIFVEQRAKGLILKSCLKNAGLPDDDAHAIRLEDMIDNLCAEVWSDWLEKQDTVRPSVLAAEQDDAMSRPAGADQ